METHGVHLTYGNRGGTMSLKNDVAKLLREAERQGWRIEDRGRRFMCFSPDGETVVTVAKTPSVQKALVAIRADLRKGGFRG